MCHNRGINDNINNLHCSALRMVYDDQTSTFEELLNKVGNVTIHQQNIRALAVNREFTQRQEYDYDYVNGRIKLQTQHYFTGIPFKSYRNPFYITVKQQITVIAI